MVCDCNYDFWKKRIVIVIMIFENLLALQFFKVYFVMFDVMLGRHICLT